MHASARLSVSLQLMDIERVQNVVSSMLANVCTTYCVMSISEKVCLCCEPNAQQTAASIEQLLKGSYVALTLIQLIN
jgi:hypothetical protein